MRAVSEQIFIPEEVPQMLHVLRYYACVDLPVNSRCTRTMAEEEKPRERHKPEAQVR